MLDLQIMNVNTTEVESFYRVPRELAHDWNYNEEQSKLIQELVKNKKSFYEYTSKTWRENSLLDIKAFFTKVLINSELLEKKDLIEYTYDEILLMLQNIALYEGFHSKSSYISSTNILLNYLKWGYDQSPRLRTNVLASSDLPHYSKMVDESELESKTITWNEMKMIIPKLDFEMNDVILSCSMEGLTLDEVLSLKRDDVNKAKETKIVNTGDRLFKLSEYAFEKVLNFANVEEGRQRIPGGKLRLAPLSSTEYVIRMTARKTSKLTKVLKSGASKRVKEDLMNCGYDGTFKDFRTSAMLNYFLDLEEDYKNRSKQEQNKIYLEVNKKFSRNFATQSLLLSINKNQLQILREKRQQEREYYNLG